MSPSVVRIGALLERYLLLHRRSLVRAFDIGFWPVMDLLVWGFVTRYLQAASGGGPFAQVVIFLIGALISWHIHYRGQQAVSISLMEEIWTRNITNVLIAPLRLWEWMAASFCYAALKIGIITVLLSVIARALYAFDLTRVGWAFLPLAANLLVFGWAIGLFTAGLLIRFGYAAEALIWGIPFLIQPFSCVFYPMSTLPAWAQLIARGLPSAYAFEGLRSALRGEPIAWTIWPTVVGLNVLYFVGGTICLVWMFRRARATGHLGRLGQD